MAEAAWRRLAARLVVSGTLLVGLSGGPHGLPLAASAQSIDSTAPTPLQSNLVQGEAEAKGQSYYYIFSGGPGDLNIKIDGETDFYSAGTRVILSDERGVELANVNLNATGNGATTSAKVHLTKQQVIKMQIRLGVNVGIHVKYKVSLGGPVNPVGLPTRLATAEPNPQVSSSQSSTQITNSQISSSQLASTLPSLQTTSFTSSSVDARGASSRDASNDISLRAEDSAVVNAPIEDKWAFIVGVSKFAKASINLKYPAKDAKDLSNYLVNEANFAPDHVKLLLDEQATKERVLAELGDKWLPRLAHPNDLVLIFISTHGSPSQADLEGLNYLVMHNTDPESLYATGLPLSDLAAAIKQRVHSNRVVLIIDACHSGAADTAKGITKVGNIDSAALSQGTGQLIICSSQPNQVSWESKRYQNGVFTHQLIEALRAGKPTLSQAFERLKESVQNEVLQDRSELQTAVLKSKWKGNDLIISAPATKPRKVPVELNSVFDFQK
ncbi:MAG: caspase family protein [Candidatus Obscuribacterales bacterium]|jgi:hypothetical protein